MIPDISIELYDTSYMSIKIHKGNFYLIQQLRSKGVDIDEESYVDYACINYPFGETDIGRVVSFSCEIPCNSTILIKKQFQLHISECTGMEYDNLPFGILVATLTEIEILSRLLVTVNDIGTSVPWEMLYTLNTGEIIKNVVLVRNASPDGPRFSSAILKINKVNILQGVSPEYDVNKHTQYESGNDDNFANIVTTGQPGNTHFWTSCERIPDNGGMENTLLYGILEILNPRSTKRTTDIEALKRLHSVAFLGAGMYSSSSNEYANEVISCIICCLVMIRAQKTEMDCFEFINRLREQVDECTNLSGSQMILAIFENIPIFINTRDDIHGELYTSIVIKRVHDIMNNFNVLHNRLASIERAMISESDPIRRGSIQEEIDRLRVMEHQFYVELAEISKPMRY